MVCPKRRQSPHLQRCRRHHWYDRVGIGSSWPLLVAIDDCSKLPAVATDCSLCSELQWFSNIRQGEGNIFTSVCLVPGTPGSNFPSALTFTPSSSRNWLVRAYERMRQRDEQCDQPKWGKLGVMSFRPIYCGDAPGLVDAMRLCGSQEGLTVHSSLEKATGSRVVSPLVQIGNPDHPSAGPTLTKDTFSICTSQACILLSY
jgi:hypothetical protein